jgi:hypothetical protein
MTRSAYNEILEIARNQAAAVARGEVDAAVAMMDARVEVIARAGAPTTSDVVDIQEIMRLDRDLSTAIRERMLAIRNEALEGQAGRRALHGYGRTLGQRRAGLNYSG